MVYCGRCVQGYRHFDFVPMSFLIPNEYSDFAGQLVMLSYSVSVTLCSCAISKTNVACL